MRPKSSDKCHERQRYRVCDIGGRNCRDVATAKEHLES